MFQNVLENSHYLIIQFYRPKTQFIYHLKVSVESQDLKTLVMKQRELCNIERVDKVFSIF